MAGVQQVEAAVGEADAPPLGPPAPHPLQRLGRLHHLGLAVGQPLVAQRAGKLVGVDHRGADLADDDSAGQVGQPRRVLQRRPGGQGCGEGGDRRVAGAGDVEHLARLAVQVGGGAIGRHHRHAQLAAGDHHGADAAVGQQPAGGALGLPVSVGREAGRLGQFLPVGREHGGTAVPREIAALGVDDHGPAVRAGGGDDAFDHGGGEHALGVVDVDVHRVVVAGGARVQRQRRPRDRIGLQPDHFLADGGGLVCRVGHRSIPLSSAPRSRAVARPPPRRSDSCRPSPRR